jgi:hypothetical protein
MTTEVQEAPEGKEPTPLQAVFAIAFVLLIVWIVGFPIVSGVQHLSHVDDKAPVRVSDYMLTLGFDPSESYTFAVGKPVSGNVGQISGNASVTLFFGSGSINGSIQPGSAVRIRVRVNGQDWQVSLPEYQVPFTAKEDVAPTVRFIIDDPVLDYRQIRYRFGPIMFQPTVWSPAHHQPTARDTPSWPGIDRNGLGTLLHDHLIQIRITAPERYRTQLYGS